MPHLSTRHRQGFTLNSQPIMLLSALRRCSAAGCSNSYRSRDVGRLVVDIIDHRASITGHTVARSLAAGTTRRVRGGVGAPAFELLDEDIEERFVKASVHVVPIMGSRVCSCSTTTDQPPAVLYCSTQQFDKLLDFMRKATAEECRVCVAMPF